MTLSSSPLVLIEEIWDYLMKKKSRMHRTNRVGYRNEACQNLENFYNKDFFMRLQHIMTSAFKQQELRIQQSYNYDPPLFNYHCSLYDIFLPLPGNSHHFAPWWLKTKTLGLKVGSAYYPSNPLLSLDMLWFNDIKILSQSPTKSFHKLKSDHVIRLQPAF